MLEMEQHKLNLICDGRVAADILNVAAISSELSSWFDIVGNLRLVPKFYEGDPDTFFSLFEPVAESRN